MIAIETPRTSTEALINFEQKKNKKIFAAVAVAVVVVIFTLVSLSIDQMGKSLKSNGIKKSTRNKTYKASS